MPDSRSVHVAPLNAVSLMKGERWPGIRGKGLTHKSPNMPIDASGRSEKRIILKVDISHTRPYGPHDAM